MKHMGWGLLAYVLLLLCPAAKPMAAPAAHPLGQTGCSCSLGATCSGNLSNQLSSSVDSFESMVSSMRTQGTLSRHAAEKLLKEADEVEKQASRLAKDIAKGKSTTKAAQHLAEEALDLLTMTEKVAREAHLGANSPLVSSANEVLQNAGAVNFRESAPHVVAFVQPSRTIPATIPGLGAANLTLDGQIIAAFTRNPGTDSLAVMPISALYHISVTPSAGSSVQTTAAAPVVAGTMTLDPSTPSQGSLCLTGRQLHWCLNLQADFTVPASTSLTMLVQVTDGFTTESSDDLCPCLSLQQASVVCSSQPLPSGLTSILTAGLFDGCGGPTPVPSLTLAPPTTTNALPVSDPNAQVTFNGTAAIGACKPGDNVLTVTATGTATRTLSGIIISRATLVSGTDFSLTTTPAPPANPVSFTATMNSQNGTLGGVATSGEHVIISVTVTATYSTGGPLSQTATWSFDK